MPGLNTSQQEIDQFIAITQASPAQAQHFLTAGTNLEGAIEDFYAAQTAGEPIQQDYEEDTDEENSPNQPLMSQNENTPAQVPAPNTGAGLPAATGHTLDGRPIESSALPAGWGAPARNMVGRVGQWGGAAGGSARAGASSGPRIATLGSMGSGGDGDDDDEETRGERTYAGGERSGLSIQAPDKPGQAGGDSVVDKILKMAHSSGAQEESQPKPKSRWTGGGNVLGEEETPQAPTPSASTSQSPPPPTSAAGLLASLWGGQPAAPQPPAEEQEAVARHLTFWRNGFSIEDGPLRPYDDPASQELLKAIEAGRAPSSEFNVRYDQPLQVLVAHRRSEDYVAPPKVLKPFEGSGNRLGSPAPDLAGAGGESGNGGGGMPGGLPGILQGGSQTATSAPTTTATSNSFQVDDSKPTTSIQVRLGDGTRLVARVNLTHTVGDLRNFVTAARSDPRSFILQTTFPNRELSDQSQTIEAAKLQNAVVVQRFV